MFFWGKIECIFWFALSVRNNNMILMLPEKSERERKNMYGMFAGTTSFNQVLPAYVD
jgi:hypothetical protein